MFQSKEQKTKEEIRRALENWDLVKLIEIGFAKFMDLLSGDIPLPFQKFLKYTSDFLDQDILVTSQREHLAYVGGKMIMELQEASAENPSLILLSADFYFQTAGRQWVVKKRRGQVSTDRFTDWDTDADAVMLQKTGRLELSIEPPETGAK